jgi:hypothetical protein
MPECADFARKIAKRFPFQKGGTPSRNWLSSLIKSLPAGCRFSEQKVLKMDWNPKKILHPQFGGMMLTRIACLLASGQDDKAEALVRAVKGEDRYRLAGEASFLIRLAESDMLTASEGNAEGNGSASAALISVCIAMTMAGYYSILLLAGDGGAVEFPICDRLFSGRLTLPSGMPGTIDGTIDIDEASAQVAVFMSVLARIEAYARISACCSIYGPLDGSADPSELFSSDGTLSIHCMPLCFMVNKIALLRPPVRWDKVRIGSHLANLFREAVAAYFKIEDECMSELPALPGAHLIRGDIMRDSAYALWPGISDIQWEEGHLKGLRLLPAPNGSLLATVRFAMSIDGIPAVFEKMVEAPPLADAESWLRVGEEARRCPDSWQSRSMSVVMEAMRMCVAPGPMKIRDGRVPSGFVSAPRRPSSRRGDVPVIYLPRGRYASGGRGADGRMESGDSGGGTGITHRAHQVAGFLRQLPLSCRASGEARIAAERHGLRLPESGYTFVRPHTRGKSSGLNSEAARRIYKIKRGDV